MAIGVPAYDVVANLSTGLELVVDIILSERHFGGRVFNGGGDGNPVAISRIRASFFNDAFLLAGDAKPHNKEQCT